MTNLEVTATAWKIALVFGILTSAGIITYYSLPDKNYKITYEYPGTVVSKGRSVIQNTRSTLKPPPKFHASKSPPVELEKKVIHTPIYFTPRKICHRNWKAERSLLDRVDQFPKFVWKGKTLFLEIYTKPKELRKWGFEIYNHPESEGRKVFDLIFSFPFNQLMNEGNHVVPVYVDLSQYVEAEALFNVYYRVTKEGILKIGEKTYQGKKIMKEALKSTQQKIYRTFITAEKSKGFYETYNIVRHNHPNSIVIPQPDFNHIFLQQCGSVKINTDAYYFTPIEIDYTPWISDSSDMEINNRQPIVVWGGKSLLFRLLTHRPSMEKAYFHIFLKENTEEKKVYWIVFNSPGNFKSDEESVHVSIQLDQYVGPNTEFHMYLYKTSTEISKVAETRYQHTSLSDVVCLPPKKETKHTMKEKEYYYERRSYPAKKTSIYFPEDYIVPKCISSKMIVEDSTDIELPSYTKMGDDRPYWVQKKLIFPMAYEGGAVAHSFDAEIMGVFEKSKRKRFRVVIFDKVTDDPIKDIAYSRLCIDLESYASENAFFDLYKREGEKYMFIKRVAYLSEKDKFNQGTSRGIFKSS